MRDIDIRTAVRLKLAAEHAGDDDTRIVEEMGIWSGSVRIDVAVINGSLTGYELKSDRDTLDRLPLQADLYSRVFDQVHLVVGRRHAEKARLLIPDWWGVTVATVQDGNIELVQISDSKPNPIQDAYLIAQLLWRAEAVSVLEAFAIDKGWRSKRIKLIHERLANELSLDELKYQVRSSLKRRESWLRATINGLIQRDD